MSLYHFEIGFPVNVTMIVGVLNLKYSNHAIRASQDDRYGRINLPSVLDTQNAKLIEIEVENGIVIKGVYRVFHSDTDDLIIVAMRDGFVKTVWINKHSDKHRTLDHSKYSKVK